MARFYILDMGLWDVPRNEMIAPETEEIRAKNLRYTIPGYAVLIQDRQVGNVLFDTGSDFNWEENWPAQFKKDYCFHRLENLMERLSLINLTVNDIELLICSHLHYDHAGNIKLFKGTKAGQRIMISEAEAKEAFVKVACSPDGVSGAYYRNEIIMDGIGYQTISEDIWISDDIGLFIQRGHTPGVIGLIVKTEKSGNFIFTSDGIYSPLNYGPPIALPGLCIDPESYRLNIVRVHKMREDFKAQIFFSHDVAEFDKMKKVPVAYE